MASADFVFLKDLTLVLVVAGITSVVFHRLRQPVVLGYLLAGVIVGPFTFPVPLVSDVDSIRLLGDLGIIVLLFALGLEFNFHKVRRVGLTALVAGLIETSVMVWLGYSVGRFFGFAPLESVFLGAIAAISSTVIIVKLLTELKQKDEEWAQVIFGVLIIEDIIAVVILTLIATAGGSGAFAAEALIPVVLKLGIFLAAALVFGLVIVPRLVGTVARFPVEEVLTVTVLGLAFGFAVLAEEMGLSSALGAFIMGALISESHAAETVEKRVTPIRDLFTSIFFVAVGMLVDPAALLQHWQLILTMTVAVVVGKVVGASFATFVTGHDTSTALRVGFGLAQIGEFSFVIATVALATGTTDAPLFVVAVAVSALTAFGSPFMLRSAPRAIAAFDRFAPRPLRTYTSLYSAWVRRIKELRENDPLRRDARHAGVRVALYGGALVAVAAIGSASIGRVTDLLTSNVPAVSNVALVAGWTVVGLMLAPFAILFGRSLSNASSALAQAALPERFRANPHGQNVQAVLRQSFFLAGVVTLAAVTLGVASPFIPALPLLVVVGVTVVGSGTILYKSLSRFHRHVDDALGHVITGHEQDHGGGHADQQEILSLIRDAYPWEVEATEVTLTPTAWGANRSVRDLRLRSQTGATIVGVRRGLEQLTNPPPEMIVVAGDTLILLGEDTQVEAAKALLLKPGDGTWTRAAETEWREVVVPDASAFVGRTLATTRLRERTGATVVAVTRGLDRHRNPPPDWRVQAEDILVVFGSEAQVARAQEAIEAPEDDAAGDLPS